MIRFLFALVAIACLCPDAEAIGRRRFRNQGVRQQTPTPFAPTVSTGAPRSQHFGDALDEVNAARAARGLYPFVRDEGLTQAAQTCALLRSQHFLAGHTANDFAALPPDSYASAAGCGAMEPSWGWGTCCTYENWRYAGAAMVYGADGKRYMHLFVR